MEVLVVGFIFVFCVLELCVRVCVCVCVTKGRISFLFQVLAMRKGPELIRSSRSVVQRQVSLVHRSHSRHPQMLPPHLQEVTIITGGLQSEYLCQFYICYTVFVYHFSKTLHSLKCGHAHTQTHTYTYSGLFLNMLAKLVGVIWSKTYCVQYVLIWNLYVVTRPVTVAEFVLLWRPVAVCELCSNLKLP